MLSPLAEGSPPVVLVVEDDAETCRLVRAALSPVFAVTGVGASAADVAQGAALLPELVVAGAATALRLRMEPGLAAVPLLLVTDPTDVQARGEILQRGAQDYLVRPFSPVEIRVRAGNLVAMKRARNLLRRDLGCDDLGLEALARASSLRRRALAAELDAAHLARERADRLSRTKTAYLRTVGHELSAPLSSLREGLVRLREGARQLAAVPAAAGTAVPAAAGHAAAVRAIEVSTEWIAELGKAMLEFARAGQDGG